MKCKLSCYIISFLLLVIGYISYFGVADFIDDLLKNILFVGIFFLGTAICILVYRKYKRKWR